MPAGAGTCQVTSRLPSIGPLPIVSVLVGATGIEPLLTFFLGGFAAGASEAQTYPAKTVRLVAPYPPGGPNDLIARIVAQRMTQTLGQQWIVDNRGGATGTIGHALASKSPSDGYTLLLGTNSTFAIAPHLYKNIQYNNETAFAPISLVAVNPQILTSHASLPVRNARAVGGRSRVGEDRKSVV